MSNRRKLYWLLIYLCTVGLIWIFRVPLLGVNMDDPFGRLQLAGFENLFRVGSVAGFIGLIMLCGVPLGCKSIHENLQRIGFVNSAGETPLLVASRPDKDNPHVAVLEFLANGIPLADWGGKER